MRSILMGLAGLSLLLTACNKEPGEGGRAEIQGLLYERRYSSLTGLPTGAPYPLADTRVSIIYGDGDYADNDTRTGPSGEFHFPWLRKGDYRLYAIGECRSCPEGTEATYVDVEISGRKDVVTADTIIVKNYSN